MLNGEGFTYDRVGHLWLVDASTGEATRLTDGPTAEHDPAWSPDGTRIAFSADRRRDHDLAFRSDLYTIDVATREITAVTAGPKSFFTDPTWMPDGRTIVALGHRFPSQRGVPQRPLAVRGGRLRCERRTAGRNLSGEHDLMPGSGMNSDVTIGDAHPRHPDRRMAPG